MAQLTTLQQADWFLAQNYDGTNDLQSTFECTQPLLQLLRAERDQRGSPHKCPLRNSQGAGVSPTYSAALASSKGAGGIAFMIEHAQLYGHVPLADMLNVAADNDGSFVDYVAEEIDAKVAEMGDHTSGYLQGDGSGRLARIGAIAGNVLTLTNPGDAWLVKLDAQIEVSANDGTNVGHVLRAGAPGYLTVTAVDPSTGQVTVSAIGDVTGVIVNDYLFLRGGFGGVNLTTNRIFRGLKAWLSGATAATDTLWGVARTGRPELSGFHVPAAVLVGSALERLTYALAWAHKFSHARPNKAIVDTMQFRMVSNSMQSQGVRILDKSSMTGFSQYKALELVGPGGIVEVVADKATAATDALLINTDTLYITHSTPKMVDFFEVNGSKFHKMTDQVGMEVILRSYFNLACKNPAQNGIIQLPVAA